MRGFAVSQDFKDKYPERYNKLTSAFEKALERKDVQKFLKASDIGGDWVGPELSSEMMNENFETFKQYSYLLE